MAEYYWYDANHNIYEVDMHTWAKRFEDFKLRRIALTEVGEETVSTVFLGLNHNYGTGPPLVFETMAGDYMWRYSTWDEACAGHVEVVKRLMTGQSLDDLP